MRIGERNLKMKNIKIPRPILKKISILNLPKKAQISLRT